MDLLLSERGVVPDLYPFCLLEPIAGLALGMVSGPGYVIFFFSSRRRHTILVSDWSSDVCSSDLQPLNRKARNGGELRLALGIFIQSGAQRTFFPGFLFGGGFAVRGSWLCVSYGLCRFLGMIAHSAPVSCGRYFMLCER